MATVSPRLQTPAFKAFIDIAPEKHVAGFAGDQNKKPVASSGGFKGMLVSVFNSIASAVSSKFSSAKAAQGTQAHQAFKTALQSEYGNAIAKSVTTRCGLDTALASGSKLSGAVIQNAYKTAENLAQIAKFEKEVVETSAVDNNARFQSLCKNQGININLLTMPQRQSFDALIRDSGLIRHTDSAAGNFAPNTSLLLAGQALALRIAAMPDSAFDHHVTDPLAGVAAKQQSGQMTAPQANEMRGNLMHAARNMEFATSVHALAVGEFLGNITQAGVETLVRDSLILARTNAKVCGTLGQIRAAAGRNATVDVDDVKTVNANAMKKALTQLPTTTSTTRQMELVTLMAQSPSSVLCRLSNVLFGITQPGASEQALKAATGKTGMEGIARASTTAEQLVVFAALHTGLTEEDTQVFTFKKGGGEQFVTAADTATMLEQAKQFVSF